MKEIFLSVFVLSFLAVNAQTVKVPCYKDSVVSAFIYQSGWHYDTSVYYETYVDTIKKFRCNYWCQIGWTKGRWVIKDIKTDSLPYIQIDSLPIYTTIPAHDTLVAGVCDSVVSITKFGVLVNGDFTPSDKADITKKLGAKYVRGSTKLSDFTGIDRAYETYINSGLKTVWNLSWEAQLNGTRYFVKDPQKFAKKEADFLQKYKPELIVIENEEDNLNYYSGSRQDYINQLKAACDTAKKYGVPITNGGLHDDYFCYKVAQDLKARGKTDSLNEWMNLTFTPIMTGAFNGKSNMWSDKVKMYDTLYNAYKGIKNLSFINVHIYQDSSANKNINYDYLKTIISYIEKTSGKEVITNETGQKNTTSDKVVNTMLDAYDKLNTKYVVWFSGDGDGGAMGLQNNDGSLRDNGLMFKTYMR